MNWYKFYKLALSPSSNNVHPIDAKQKERKAKWDWARQNGVSISPDNHFILYHGTRKPPGLSGGVLEPGSYLLPNHGNAISLANRKGLNDTNSPTEAVAFRLKVHPDHVACSGQYCVAKHQIPAQTV